LVRELAAPLVFLALSGLYLATSLTFPLGSTARPGAGFFPAAVGVYLCALAVVVTIATWRRAWRRGPAVRGAAMAAEARMRVTATMAALTGFCVALGWLGYPASAFLFTALLLRTLGRGRWPSVLVAALLAAAASYYLFAVLLGVPLPRGLFVD
jgi:putative tricarboxylic transport membrane protein